MQTPTEFMIWDKIVCSAKKKFDLDPHEEKLKNIDPEVFDKLILHIILGFASGEDHGTIAINLHNELQHIGIEVKESIIDTFVTDKHKVFKAEIYAAYMAFTLLEGEASEYEVLGAVTDLLDRPPQAV